MSLRSRRRCDPVGRGESDASVGDDASGSEVEGLDAEDIVTLIWSLS